MGCMARRTRNSYEAVYSQIVVCVPQVASRVAGKPDTVHHILYVTIE